MNNKGFSLVGILLLVVGFVIIGFSWYPCISGGAPYDIQKATSCMLSLTTLLLTGIGTLIAFIGAWLNYYSK